MSPHWTRYLPPEAIATQKANHVTPLIDQWLLSGAILAAQSRQCVLGEIRFSLPRFAADFMV